MVRLLTKRPMASKSGMHDLLGSKQVTNSHQINIATQQVLLMVFIFQFFSSFDCHGKPNPTLTVIIQILHDS